MNNRPKTSIHAPKSKKPQTETEFGFFLAGLIDANGYIDKSGHVVIRFPKTQASAAYYIKKVLGYGSVKTGSVEAELLFTVSHPKGLVELRDLVRNKLRHPDRVNEFGGIKIDQEAYQSLKGNHWLAGFIQGSQAFQIKTVTSPGGALKEVRPVVQIDQKTGRLLSLIKKDFGGYVGYRQSQDTYYYSSVNFNSACQLITYLDRYQVLGACLTGYWLWRKAYLLVQAKAHLTELGQAKLLVLKVKIAKL